MVEVQSSVDAKPIRQIAFAQNKSSADFLQMFDQPESEYIYHEGTDYFRVTPKGESWDMIQYRADDSYSTDPNEVEKLIRVSTVQPITKHQWSTLADSTMRKYNKSQQLEGHDLKLPRDPADPRSDISVAGGVKIHPDMAKKMSKDKMALADDILKQISTNHFGASVLRMQLSELLFDNDAVLTKAEQHYDAGEGNRSDAARAMFMMNSELVSMLHVLAHGMINGNVSIVNTIASKFAPAVKTTEERAKTIGSGVVTGLARIDRAAAKLTDYTVTNVESRKAKLLKTGPKSTADKSKRTGGGSDDEDSKGPSHQLGGGGRNTGTKASGAQKRKKRKLTNSNTAGNGSTAKTVKSTDKPGGGAKPGKGGAKSVKPGKGGADSTATVGKNGQGKKKPGGQAVGAAQTGNKHGNGSNTKGKSKGNGK